MRSCIASGRGRIVRLMVAIAICLATVLSSIWLTIVIIPGSEWVHEFKWVLRFSGSLRLRSSTNRCLTKGILLSGLEGRALHRNGSTGKLLGGLVAVEIVIIVKASAVFNGVRGVQLEAKCTGTSHAGSCGAGDRVGVLVFSILDHFWRSRHGRKFFIATI